MQLGGHFHRPGEMVAANTQWGQSGWKVEEEPERQLGGGVEGICGLEFPIPEMVFHLNSVAVGLQRRALQATCPC